MANDLVVKVTGKASLSPAEARMMKLNLIPFSVISGFAYIAFF